MPNRKKRSEKADHSENNPLRTHRPVKGVEREVPKVRHLKRERPGEDMHSTSLREEGGRQREDGKRSRTAEIEAASAETENFEEG